MSFLKVSGSKIIDGNGVETMLYGAVWFQIREALEEVLGKEDSDFFFDKLFGVEFNEPQFLEHFFAEPDALFFKSLGLNCIRIAVGYRHFEDDMNPRVLRPDAFKHLDRVISICSAHSIYTIIDMHTAPGGQSGGWHADAGTHLANFWVHKDFQDRLIWIWTQIAAHYRDNPWVAGYNVLNEPADPHPQHSRVISFYDRAHEAIRAVDGSHIIFLDGNTFATDFSHFPNDAGTRWSNTAYSIHDYSTYGFPASPEPYTRSEEQKDRMKKTYKRKRSWMDEKGLCVWNGEWGPVYARKEYDGEETEKINEQRYMVLEDQLAIYKADRLSWSIWLYKDIGFQGMVYVSRSTPYMVKFRDFLAKKHRLAADAWGEDDRAVKHIYTPIAQLIKDSVSDPSKLNLYPPLWHIDKRVTRISRTILVAEFLVKEWAEAFRGMDREALDVLARSFSFSNCHKREGLNAVLEAHAGH
ncbi:endoglucanase family 5 glycoside hydrolase [Infundibulicybe gibba]|nr:endoglucanase family 5 glycoside hydrolase [Infundibulicybe gibba]